MGPAGFDGEDGFDGFPVSPPRWVAISQTEVDFGTTPVASMKFSISDGNVTASSTVVASLSYDAPTGKDQDELEMDAIHVVAGNESAGAFDLWVMGEEGCLADKFKINYVVN
jgi:hypothetical protein